MTATRQTTADAAKFYHKRNVSPLRSSSIRKLARYMAIFEGARPLVMPRPRFKAGNGRLYVLHPTKGYLPAS